ncbi:MAG: hypothetical protein H0W09_04720 [Solirubrobacterales bacterium]|nr:hypothetical protein [Solirubrobacterales bacterium]
MSSVLIAVIVVAVVAVGVLVMLGRGVKQDEQDRRKVDAEHPGAARAGRRGRVVTREDGETVEEGSSR